MGSSETKTKLADFEQTSEGMTVKSIRDSNFEQNI